MINKSVTYIVFSLPVVALTFSMHRVDVSPGCRLPTVNYYYYYRVLMYIFIPLPDHQYHQGNIMSPKNLWLFFYKTLHPTLVSRKQWRAKRGELLRYPCILRVGAGTIVWLRGKRAVPETCVGLRGSFPTRVTTHIHYTLVLVTLPNQI